MGEIQLFSVIVLCYRHFEFVYSAIDSVLLQTYGNIELIVSDDGSDNFPETDINNYIENNKRANIKNVIIRHGKENLGTVRHLNFAIGIAHGNYIVALAADDNFFDKNVLSNYVQGFKHDSKASLIEFAQTAMCDYSLKIIEGYYLQPHVQRVLESNYTTEELFTLLAHKPYMPSTSTCFTREFFEKYGKFNERYKLVEDVPMHLRLAREGWNIHYENFVAIKHRTGGISHGNKGGLSQTQKMYYNDLLNIYDYEIKPYYSLINTKELYRIKNYINTEQNRIKKQLCTDEYGQFDRLKYFMEFPQCVVKSTLLNNYWRLNIVSHWLLKFIICLIIIIPIISELMPKRSIENILLYTVYTTTIMYIAIRIVLCFTKIISSIDKTPNTETYIN